MGRDGRDSGRVRFSFSSRLAMEMSGLCAIRRGPLSTSGSRASRSGPDVFVAIMRAPCRRVLHAAAMTVSSLLSAGDLESGTNAIYADGEIDDDSSESAALWIILPNLRFENLRIQSEEVEKITSCFAIDARE